FRTAQGVFTAVSDANLELSARSTLAVVGESGSGKSTMSAAINRLLAPNATITSGKILFNGVDLAHASEAQMAGVRGAGIGLVPQDPMSNLNPVWNIGFQVEEAIRANGVAQGKAAKLRTIEVLKEAGLSDAEDR
ncbi:ATP-binding cassette domain-containing protein, partial [Pseudomonas sp. AB12(2023)]